MFIGDSNFEKSEKRILEVKKEEFEVTIYYKIYRLITSPKNESKRKRRKARKDGIKRNFCLKKCVKVGYNKEGVRF